MSRELLDRVRERAKQGPVSFLIVLPQSSEYAGSRGVGAARAAGARRAAPRGDRRARPGRRTQIRSPQRWKRSTTSGSTRSSSRLPERPLRLDARDLVGRLRSETGLPVEHVVSEGAEMSAHAEPIGHAPTRADANEHPPPIHYSSRINRSSSGSSSSSGRRSCCSARSSRSTSSTGSSTRRPPGAVAAVHARHAHPVRAAMVPGARQHLDPGHLELHDALGDGSVKKNNRAGLCAGMVLTLLLGLDVPVDAGDRIPPARLQHERYGVRVHVLRADRAARLHVFIGLLILLAMTIRSFRGHFSPSTITGSRSAGSTGTSST